MTELEEAELTEGQGRALSEHKTAQAYRGYAKETMRRALAATRKRHAHLLAQKQLEEQSSTNLLMAGGIHFQMRPKHAREQRRFRKDFSALSLAGAPGFEPGNGGIKISLIIQQFQGAFGKSSQDTL